MKRGAEKQLTKDADGSDEETEEVAATFKKADDSMLATRRIRGLPKRTIAGSVAPTNGNSVPEPSSSVPKFTGFAGFGTPSANSAFTFGATTTKPPSLTTQSSSEAQFQPAGTHATPSHPPTVSSTASSTAKTLASFLGAPPDSSVSQKLTSTGFATSLAFPLTKPSSTPQTTSTPAASVPPSITAEPSGTDSAIKYYTELRGLNVSLLASVTKAIQDDAFVDISQIIEQYRTHRTRIQDDYDKSKKAEISKPEQTQSKPPPAMPAPPSSFSFGVKTFESSAFKLGETSNGGGFKPTIPITGNATSSPFKFPSTAPSSSSEPEIGKTTTTPTSTATPFTFGTSSDSLASSAFSKSKQDSSSGFKFGPSSTTTAASASSPFGGSNLFAAPPSSSPFAQPSSTIPNFGGFGKPPGSGSIGNPVGFGFGALSSKGSDADSAKKTTSTSGFPFGQPSTAFGAPAFAKDLTKTEDEEGSGGDDTSAATEGDDAAKAGLSCPTPHDVEGEGEEDEETTYSAKVKAYRMKKPDERGGQGWAELGVGYLRLKKHKETDARRMLLRNSSTGKININFKLYPGFKVTQVKKALTFVGHDNGVAQTYTVRLPAEDQTRQLKEAIEGEVNLPPPREG